MHPTPESRSLPADSAHTSDYDSIAEGYTAENENSLLNAYYERPAMLELAGNVEGRRILDAGCGAGPLFAELRDRGAIMTEPLPFPDAAFDDIVASLVLHYLRDWGPALAELRRVLRPGGRLIVSVEHPFAIHLAERADGRKNDYFDTRNRVEEWTMGGQTATLSFWDRPLHAMTDAFISAGLYIDVISEPPATPAARELFPEVFGQVTGSSFLAFLFFVLHRD